MERPVEQACRIIDQAKSELTRIDSWTFGGGTALMLQIDHRERIACVMKTHGVEYLDEALRAFQDKCEAALKVAHQMNPQFAETIMTRLLYRESFSDYTARGSVNDD
jgi:hypothetical protein